MKKLTNAEKKFCRLYVESGDAEAAAKNAGLRASEHADALLCRDEVIDEIVSILKRRREMMLLMCESAMMRVIISPADKALRLAQGEIAFPQEAELRGVSEYKCTEKGSEVRFFDKVKAFEKLCALIVPEKDSSEAGLLSALAQGAKALLENGDEKSAV